MMRLIFVLIFLSFIGISTLFAQYEFMHRGSFSGWVNDPGHWREWPDLLSYEFRAPNRVEKFVNSDKVKSGTYRIIHEYNVPFITFYWDGGTQERNLMLINEYIMVLYRDNTMPVFVGLRYDDTRFRRLYSITASSTLREGHLVYAATPERLGFHINRVWAVEGGIGEKLFLTLPSPLEHSFIMSIGYVHFSRPYLFQHNSRPKRVRISLIDDETRFFEHNFEDTPNFQLIRFPWDWEWWIVENIQIEILEIFPGTRFNHLCINSIFSFNIGGR